MIKGKMREAFIKECEELINSGRYNTKKEVFELLYSKYGYTHVYTAIGAYYSYRKRPKLEQKKHSISLCNNSSLQKTLDYIKGLGVMDNCKELSIINRKDITKILKPLDGLKILYFLLDENYNIIYIGRSEKISLRLSQHKNRYSKLKFVVMASMINKELLKSYERYLINKINIDQHGLNNFRTLESVIL